MKQLTFKGEVVMDVKIKEKDISAIRLHMKDLSVSSIAIQSSAKDISGAVIVPDSEYIYDTYKITHDGIFQKGLNYKIKIIYTGNIHNKHCHGICFGIDNDIENQYNITAYGLEYHKERLYLN